MSKVQVNLISNIDGTANVPSETVIAGSAKAWVNFNGDNTTIRDDFNVSSITDGGAGRYTVNYSSALSNANYSAIAGTFDGTNNNRPAGVGAITTTTAIVYVTNYAYAYEDQDHVRFVAFGN